MITAIAKSISISCGIALAVLFFISAIDSSYLTNFLKLNIVTIQIGLLAINAATLGVVLTKLRDLVQSGVPVETFSLARENMLLSIKEQVWLIVSALVILSLMDAKNSPIAISPFLLNMLLIACFTYSLMILYDTAKSVFVVLDE